MKNTFKRYDIAGAGSNKRDGKITLNEYDDIVKRIRKKRDSIEHNLTIVGRSWLKDNYNVKLTHDIAINARLTRSMGRVSVRKSATASRIGKIEISEKMILDYIITGDPENLIGVLKHELIHYGLFKLNKPYSDNDEYFINECKEKEVILKVRGLAEVVHEYRCESGHKLEERNRINTNNYICKCKSRLKYKGRKIRMNWLYN